MRAALCLFIFFVQSQLMAFELIMEDGYKPYSYTENGEIKGEYAEVVKKAMKIMGIEKNITAYPFARGYKMMESLQGHAMFAIVRTQEREEKFKWACPVGISETWLVKNAKSDTPTHKNLEELKRSGAKVGVVNGFAVHKFLENANVENLDVAHNREMMIKKFMVGRYEYMPVGSIDDVQNPETIGLEKGSIIPAFKLYDTVKCVAFTKDVDDAEVKKWQEALLRVGK